MPGYTSEEVQGVVNQFLLTSVTTPQTSLNARDVLSAHGDIYALLTTTLLLKPNSYFYVIFLAKNRLEALRRQQAADLAFILSDTTKDGLQNRAAPVTSTTELVNAQAALLNINAGLNSGSGTRSTNLGPEVDRFRAHIGSFVSSALSPSVVAAGVPTETAGELQKEVATRWAAVKTRHAQMLTLCTAIQDALDNLSSAQLPQKAVETVVSNLSSRLDELTASLPQDTSGSTYRTAMLELLTMRTLLAKVSTFRNPQQLLAPLKLDGTQITGSGGVTPASITGSISGPFNVPPSSTLDFESGAPVVASSIPIPGYSNAEIASAVITYPITFPVGAELKLSVDGTSYTGQSYSAAFYASQALFLASIQSYLTTFSIPATAYASGGRIFIRSNSADDISSVLMETSTAGRLAFVTTTGFATTAVCKPIPAKTIIAASVPYPAVRLSEALVEYGNFTGLTAAASLLDLMKASGVLDTTAGGASFTAPTNFEAAGIRIGDSIRIGTQVLTILSVFGARFTVSENVIAPNIGGAIAFQVGFDFTTVPVGTRVLLSSNSVPLNSGPYRVVSGDVGQLTVDRAFFALADPVTAFVLTSYLVSSAPNSTSADGITAWPASAGATAVGYIPSATQVHGGLTLFSIAAVDLFVRGVEVGDTLTVLNSPAATALLSVVGMSTVETATAIPFFSGSLGYTIQSTKYLLWLDLVSTLELFQNTVDFDAADFAITRLVSGASPVPLLSPSGAIGNYYTALVALADIQNYSIALDRGIDNILKMLTEQGFDRAADLLTSLQITEFFSMHPDGVSYSTHLIRTAAEVTRQVAPQSRFAKSFWAHPEVRLFSRRRG